MKRIIRGSPNVTLWENDIMCNQSKVSADMRRAPIFGFYSSTDTLTAFLNAETATDTSDCVGVSALTDIQLLLVLKLKLSCSIFACIEFTF